MTQKGLILVLVPFLFELLFVGTFAVLFFQGVEMLNRIDQDKRQLAAVNDHTNEFAISLLDIWHANSTPSEHREEELLRQLHNYKVQAANLFNFQIRTKNQQLLDLIKEAKEEAEYSIQMVDKNTALVEGRADAGINHFTPASEVYERILALDELMKKIAQASMSIGSDEPEQMRQMRMLVSLCLFIGVLTAFLISLALSAFFTSDILHRLMEISENAYLLGAGKPLNQPQPGSDEIAELDQVLHHSYDLLEESRRKELAVLDNAQDVICAVDNKMRIVASGAAAAKVWLYEPEDLLGKSVLSIIAEDGKESTRQTFTRLAENHGEGLIENRIVCRDGSVKYSEWTVHWSPEQRKFFCVVRDVTERRAVEMLKQRFISIVSHDLRAPLSAVGISLNLLQSGKRGEIPEAASTQFRRVETSMKRLVTLIDELLELDKLESGKLTLEPKTISASRICYIAVDSLNEMAKRSAVRLRFDAPADEYHVVADEHRLVQVLVNLLSNAIKFSPPDSTVTVSILPEADSLQFKITDQGPGIPLDQQSLIFQKFHQTGVQAKDSRHKGTGLGLAIVKAIVDAHKGKLGVNSTPGQGSTFWFSIPHSPLARDEVR